jgi:hypothetical protein
MKLTLPTLLGRLRTSWRPSFVFLRPLQGEGAAPGNSAIAPHDEALLAWRDWCAAHPGHRCRVGLSNQWLMNGVVPVGQAANAAAAIAEAAKPWGHYFNVDAPQLSVHWHARAVRAGDAWLASAIPRQLVADLGAVAQAHGVTMVWVGPWWAHGGQRWFDQVVSQPSHSSANVMLVAQEPQWRVCLSVQQGQLVAVWAEPGTGQAQVDLAAAAPDGHKAVCDSAPCMSILSGQSPQWSLRT